ncbi:MAG: AEC family transporter [Methylococcales bacterium]|nr:AEC family transporter [Methylococcales bacterium]
MIDTLTQMALMIAIGLAWRSLTPAGLSAERVRPILTSLVLYVFLPALVLEVLWQAPVGVNSVKFSIIGITCIVASTALAAITGLLLRMPKPRLGALILASAFANVTYLGLPVLQETFGPWARSVAIQMDFFAASPMVFTLGVWVAKKLGTHEEVKAQAWWRYFNIPPFWAAGVAVALNIYQVPMPTWLAGTLAKLAAGVTPLMLIALGLALNWRSLHGRVAGYMLPVVLVKLAAMPAMAWLLVQFLPLPGEQAAAAVLEMAMPSMVLGLVFCDRYRLDSELFAMAVTVTTALSFITLPFWYRLLT